MTENRVVQKIVLTPRVENPIMPKFEYGDLIGVNYGICSLPPKTSRLFLGSINLDHWEVMVQTEYTDRFKKVASVVGKDQAPQVLRALDREVPEDWEEADLPDWCE